MKERIAFVAYYQKQNIYSFNALIGAIETDDNLKDISIYYVRGKQNLFKELLKIKKKHQNVVLGISFFTTQLWEINNLVKELRKNFLHEIIIIAGGPHPTGEPLRTLKMGFDIVVIGEGEETICELLKTIKHNGDFKEIKGIAYLNGNNEYKYTGKRTLVNLDIYPPFPIKNTQFGAIEITRGCPYVCYYCQTPYILGTQPRHRSVECICKYIEFMKREKLTDIRFISPNAFSYGSKDGKTLNIAKIEDLLSNVRKIIGNTGKLFFGSFPSEVRPEHVTKETLDLVLRYANNDNIIIGAQSGSQRILDLCHRDHSIEDVINAVEISINAGLKVNVDFIFGLPNESDEDIKLTIKMMDYLTKKGAKIHTHAFIPLPQTPFAQKKVQPISKKLKDVVNELNSRGLAFGEWKKQEQLAMKISKYFKQTREA
ncbi:MAG: TIGR04013 family B12-binding domain/radical SAM domain-containing protein [Promethearchaeota archaeon]|nr:MAG: TIGR04013 family B12-binding domain/radical SAM domain-containing protein [Candidatus Lokiarchaeota archaeon]